MSRRLKLLLKSVMTRKNIKVGQIAYEISQDPMQLSVWLARDDGKSINKLIQIADAMNCDIAFIDRETNDIYR